LDKTPCWRKFESSIFKLFSIFSVIPDWGIFAYRCCRRSYVVCSGYRWGYSALVSN